ncbi:MAG: VCBS repeat-containing protein, partial [Verrucomicrobia bacterium]|nr:VCBS repeat-containing protein [Verrucomicrobiota bacterium]
MDWAAARTTNGLQGIQGIDARHLVIMTRRGPPPFQPVLTATIPAPKDSFPIDPLIIYDLEGNGLPEIILPAKNLLYRRHGPDRYAPEPLCRYSPGLVQSAVIADFDGDGFADLLCAKAQGLLLFKGSPQGTFDQPGQLVWAAQPPLKDVMAITCGDIDHDGDLDVFLAQYDVPTLGQMLRPHYYDANDGYPAYLLLNDGHGHFTDATTA